METKLNSISLPYTVLIATLQVALSILPGFILAGDQFSFTIQIAILLIYLFISDFVQVFIRTAYKKGQAVSMQAYVVKIAVSLFMIGYITSKSAIQFAVILLAYEVFQFLTFSEKYHYQDTLFHTLTNSFFKGIVFNLMIIIAYPYNFKLVFLEPFIFSFAIILFGTVIIQNIYSFLAKKRTYILIGVLAILSIAAYLYFSYTKQNLSLLLFIILGSVIALGTLFVVTKKQMRQRELLMNIVQLLSLAIYYSNYLK